MKVVALLAFGLVAVVFGQPHGGGAPRGHHAMSQQQQGQRGLRLMNNEMAPRMNGERGERPMGPRGNGIEDGRMNMPHRDHFQMANDNGFLPNDNNDINSKFTKVSFINKNKDINIGADDSNSFTKVSFINKNKNIDNDDTTIDDTSMFEDDIIIVNNVNNDGLTGVPKITFCNTTSTPLVINSYTISPDDIEPNEEVTITLHTTLVGETVTGGTIALDAKLGKIPIVDESYDLCTEIESAGLSCPLAPGNYDLSETVDIPSIPISGTVTATATLYDQSKNELACVEVEVTV